MHTALQTVFWHTVLQRNVADCTVAYYATTLGEH